MQLGASMVDIESFDVAFDAASIVFSAKLAPDHLLILAADMGGNFYARENRPGS